MVQPDRPLENLMRHMRSKRWIPKTTNTHTEYTVLIHFPLSQWMPERASVLSYTYIPCVVSFYSNDMYTYTIQCPGGKGLNEHIFVQALFHTSPLISCMKVDYK